MTVKVKRLKYSLCTPFYRDAHRCELLLQSNQMFVRYFTGTKVWCTDGLADPKRQIDSCVSIVYFGLSVQIRFKAFNTISVAVHGQPVVLKPIQT